MKLILLAAFVFGSPLARALVVEPAAVQKQLSAAPLVADVTVLDLEGQAIESNLQFHASLRLDEVHRSTRADGPSAGDVVSVRGPGGEAGGIGLFLTGYPRPHKGRSYRAYLTPSGDGYAITGFEYGLVPLGGERAFSRNRTDGSNGEGNGAFLFWDRTFLPIPYAIAMGTFVDNPHFVLAIDRAFQTWSSAPGSRISFFPQGCSLGKRNLNDGINHVIFLTETWPFDPAAIAITRNFYVAGESPRAGSILDSDILLNGVNHSFTTTVSADDIGKHDVQNIVTHEVGHFIGLGHEVTPFDSEAVMFAQAAPNELKKRTLKSDDLSALRSAYGGAADKPPSSKKASCVLADVGAKGCAATHFPTSTPANPAWLAVLVTLTLAVRLWARRVTR